MTSQQYLQTQTQQVRSVAYEAFEQAADLIQVDELQYLRLKQAIHRLLDPAMSLVQELSLLPLAQEIGLKLCYGAVNYCFVHPYSQVEYIYTWNNAQTLRSLG